MRKRLEQISFRGWLVVAAIAAVAGLSAGTGAWVGSRAGDEDVDPPPAEAGVAPPGAKRISFLAKLIPPPADRPQVQSGPRVPRSVSDLAKRLPVERKVAQLFLLGFRGQDLNASIFQRLRDLDLGGIVIEAANYLDPTQLASLAGEGVVISQQEKHVPPWVMAPQEGGAFNAFFDLPPANALADDTSAGQAAQDAGAAGSALKPLGVTGVLAPVADVGTEDGGALGGRAFSDDPDQVAAAVSGIVDAYRGARVFSAAAHFPGLGSATQPPDEGPANVGLSLDELRARDLIPFEAAIRAGVPGIIVSSGLYATDDFVTPGTLSSAITTDLLRKDLGFEGVAITDDLANPSITALFSTPDAAVEAVRAGADMLFISGPPGDQQAAYAAVLRAVRRGEIRRARLDEAVLRILAAKRDYGLIG